MLACYITDSTVATKNSSEKVADIRYRMTRYHFHELSEQLLNIQT